MRIQTEDGRLIEVEDSATPEQIDEVLTHVSAPQAQQSPSYFQRMGNIIDEGSQKQADITNMRNSGEQGVASTGIQRLGAAAGQAGSLALETVKSTMHPSMQQGIADSGRYLYSQAGKLGNALPDVTPKMDYRFSPETKRNIDAGLNMAGSIPAVGAADLGLDLAKSGGIGLKSIIKPSIKMDSKAIGDMAGQAYQAAHHLDAQFPADFADRYINDLSASMPQNPWGAATIGDNEITKLLDRLRDAQKTNTPITVQSLKEMTEGYNKKISDSIVNGKMDSDGQDLLTAKSILEDMAKNEPAQNLIGDKEGVQALFDAKDLFHQKSRLDLIEQIEKKSEIADNSASVRKRAYARLLTNPKFMNGFKNNPEMAAQIEKAARTGAATDILREAGSRLGANIIGAVGGAAGSPGGPLGVITGIALGHGVAAGARNAADFVSRRPVKKLTDLIGKEALKSGYLPRKKP